MCHFVFVVSCVKELKCQVLCDCSFYKVLSNSVRVFLDDLFRHNRAAKHNLSSSTSTTLKRQEWFFLNTALTCSREGRVISADESHEHLFLPESTYKLVCKVRVRWC